MAKKVKISMVILVLLGSVSLPFLIGCSAIRDTASWIPFLNSRENHCPVVDKNAEQFLSRVRPHQGDPESIYLLACHFQKIKKHKLALKEFSRVIAIDPTFVKAYNGMAVSYDLLGEFSSAEKHYNKALELNPGQDYVQNNLGYSYLMQGKPDPAIEAFRKAIALDSGNKRYHNNLALAYAKKGRFDLAFEEFKKGGNEARAHHNLAKFYYQKGLYWSAKNHFARALTIDPSFAKTRAGLEAAEALAKISAPKREKNQASFEEKGHNTFTKFENIQNGRKSRNYTIQAGAFRNLKNAHIRKDRLIEKGYNARIQKEVKGKPFYSVCVGSFKTKGEAEGEALKLAEMEGIKTYLKNPMDKPRTLAQKSIPAKKSNDPLNRTINKDCENVLRGLNVEISNGNGVYRMARRVGSYLRKEGLERPRLTNANHFNHLETKIYYRKGYLHKAYGVAEKIPGYQNMEQVSRFKRANINVRVLIGKDMIPFDTLLFTNRYQKS